MYSAALSAYYCIMYGPLIFASVQYGSVCYRIGSYIYSKYKNKQDYKMLEYKEKNKYTDKKVDNNDDEFELI